MQDFARKEGEGHIWLRNCVPDYGILILCNWTCNA